MKRSNECSLLASWSCCARDQPRHKQALKELLSDEQAHKPEPGFLVNKARMMIAAPGPKKYCKHKGRCTFEGRFSSYSHGSVWWVSTDQCWQFFDWVQLLMCKWRGLGGVLCHGAEGVKIPQKFNWQKGQLKTKTSATWSKFQWGHWKCRLDTCNFVMGHWFLWSCG